SRGGRGHAVPAAALPGRAGGREAVRACDRADRRASVGAGGFRRPGLGGLPARSAGAAAGRAAGRGPAARRGRAAGTGGGPVRRARPPADQRARVRRRGAIAAAGADPEARHGHPAGHGAVRARRPGGAGPVPQRVLAAARAAAGLRVGVAASPAETEALLTTLTSHVVEVTQTRLTNVYDSVETYNAATTGATVPYHVLVLAGFPAGISDRAGELLGRLARNGPRSGLYIVATVDPWLDLPRGFDLAGLTALGTTVSLDEHGDLGWDDPDFAGSVIE